MTIMNLHPGIITEMAGNLAQELQEELDWQVIINGYLALGWTKIEINWPNRMSAKDAYQVKEWCRANLQGHYNGRNRIWLFEKSKDATMFMLKWS